MNDILPTFRCWRKEERSDDVHETSRPQRGRLNVLCGQVDRYRTILEDFKKVEDFVKWMGERESEIL